MLGSVHDYIQEVDGGYMCLICSKIIKFKSDAYRHIRMKHTDSNDQVDCHICGKTQKHHWALGDHMRKCHGQSAKGVPIQIQISHNQNI